MGISALVPFRNRIAGTHYRRSTRPGTNPPLGAALGCAVMCAALGTVFIHGEYAHAAPPLVVAGLAIVVGWITWRQRLADSA